MITERRRGDRPCDKCVSSLLLLFPNRGENKEFHHEELLAALSPCNGGPEGRADRCSLEDIP